ncbi:class I adenylate-forming enzyme family protein [Bacillus sp. V5-8f]|uniref:class I adenylate-forming enzyme family protein n=1 Tax=Bacillus sp. V5-8f TaxID=2053044 RepID=UPI0015E07009|nr:class I adenylate-forming enzyme family protein [Bacillus sp. V5-8f]
MADYWGQTHKLVSESDVQGIKIKVYNTRPRNLNETLAEAVRRFPDKVALVHEDQQITYKALKAKVNQIAWQLKNTYGIKKGDRVAFLLMNGIPFVAGVYAALQIGAVAVPLNTKLKATELEYMLTNSGAKILIANKEWWPNVEPVRNAIPTEKIFITDEQTPDRTLPFSRLIQGHPGEIEEEQLDEHDSAFIMYTSGTTGKPKGALITHFNMIHTAMNYEHCYNLSSDDSTVIAVPVFHITGLAAQLITFIYLGGKIVLMPMFNPKKFLEILQNEHITHVIASPTVYVMTLMEPDLQDYKIESFRVGGFGGAPMPGETLVGLKKWIPNIELHNTYGLTETTSPAVIMPTEHQMQKISSVGVPTPVTEVKIVNPDTNEEVMLGEVGELVFKGPMVIREYWNNEEATSKAIKDGWFSTGDLAMMDEDGFITIMDRIKDMINRGGEKIYSVEVEDILYANQKIMDAAIVGVPDDKYGEAVKACVVPRAGEELTEKDVQDWVKERLAKYKVPKYVEIMEVLPRNPNGKVIKTQLRYIPKFI